MAAAEIWSAGNGDFKLEVVIIPVSDVDRSKRFYGGLGWRLDADFAGGKEWRVVQMTPPASPCSIQFGVGITTATPGSAQGLYLVVPNLETARAALVGHGVAVSEVFHYTAVRGPRVPGPDPQRRSYCSWASFSDPDGNGWLLQEVTQRLPGRGLSLDIATLTNLLREAEKRHAGYEATAPKHEWPEWYAAYMVAREQGRTPEEATGDAALHMEHATH